MIILLFLNKSQYSFNLLKINHIRVYIFRHHINFVLFNQHHCLRIKKTSPVHFVCCFKYFHLQISTMEITLNFKFFSKILILFLFFLIIFYFLRILFNLISKNNYFINIGLIRGQNYRPETKL